MGLFRLIRKAFLFISVPIQKWMQRRGRREVLITQEIVDRLVGLIKPGDILGSHEDQRWTSIFIKGFYDHAAIAVCHEGILKVVEAVGDMPRRDEFGKWILNPDGTPKNFGGVRLMPLEEWLFKKDYIFVTRPNLPEEIVEKAWRHALTLIGRGYDYYFTMGDDFVFCSELIVICYQKFWPPFMSDIGAVMPVLPQMFWDYAQHNICFYLDPIINTKLIEDGFKD